MVKQIPFHKPFISGQEVGFVNEVIQSGEMGTGGRFSNLCEDYLTEFTGSNKTLLTSSCTHALEMAAILANIETGDEVIMPSFNFVSAANAFALRGAKIVFVDINPISMNIDPLCMEAAITDRTKAILIMHYGGVACEMDRILPIIKNHNLFLIEDAAHCIGAKYKGQHLGTFGQLGTLSFHYTKNIHCGEGGALLINDLSLIDRAEIIREKGTNRKQFFDGKIDKYTWVDIGSSYLMSEMSAAFLWGQLSNIHNVTEQRIYNWNIYKSITDNLAIPSMPSSESNNGHLFFIKCKDREDRKSLINSFRTSGLTASFHYIPLHKSKYALDKFNFYGTDNFTSTESNRLLRFPLFYGMPKMDHLFSQLENYKSQNENF